MKNKIALIVLSGLTLGIYSCTKDHASKSVSIDCTAVTSADNTYNNRIGAILNNSCGTGPGCHDIDNYQGNGNIRFDTYQTAKESFQNKPTLCTIKQESGCLPMPQGAPKLADSLITYLQCWAENGYAQ